MTELSLPQALLLLALDDEKGTKLAKDKLGYGLAAAVLSELALIGRVHLEVVPRSLGPLRRDDQKVRLISAAPTDLPSCDMVLERIAAEQVRSPKAWVERLNKKLADVVAGELVDRGVVRHERVQLLGMFPSDRYPEADPAPERQLREALDAVVRSGATPTERVACLAVLADAAGVLDRAVPHLDRRARKARLEELREGQWAGEAAKAAIQAAATAAAAAAAITVSVTSS